MDFGITRNKFHETVFEKSPYLKERAFNPDPYDWHIIDRALDLQDPTRDLIKIIKNGRIDPKLYVEEFIDIGIRRRRIQKEKLYSFMSSGASLVINRIELVSAAAYELCLQVGRLLGTQTTANAYASMGGDPATNVHWDTHDVFVVQLKGKKHWQVYEPTFKLPISTQISNDHKEDVPKNPYLETVLNAGDALYVPRGWWHRVAPIGDNDTISLTIAIHTPLILDYIIWACSHILPEHLELRHSLLGGRQDAQHVEEALVCLSSMLRDRKSLDAFYERSKERERVVSPFDIATHAAKLPPRLEEGSVIVLNSRSASADAPLAHINGQPSQPQGLEGAIIEHLKGTVRMTVAEIRSNHSDKPTALIDCAIVSLMAKEYVQALRLAR